MAVKIRLQRHGKKNFAFFHIVVADSRSPRDGRFIEQLGSYNPNTNPATIILDADKALKWLNVGAQPTLTTRRILITIVFALLRFMPEEGYFNNYEKMSPAQIELGLIKMGLKDPLYVQVVRFIGNLLKGDLGVSYRYRVNTPIARIIAPKIAISAKLGIICMVLSLPLGLALGVLMARYKGKFWDKLGNAYIVFIQAVPNAV